MTAGALVVTCALFQLSAGSLNWTPQTSSTDASLRGLSVVSAKVVWASGTKGTFLLTTDGGQHWRARTVPGAEQLDFRDVEAFDETTAYLLASGEGANSRLYKTTDGGANWVLLFTNPDAKGFFDAVKFWGRSHGIILGDPVDGRFAVFTTDDAGKTWQRQPTPPALADEGAFAASGTCLVVRSSKQAWFATGGPAGARVFRTHDRGRTWEVASAPIGSGSKSAGIFSLAFLNANDGVAVGGDYQQPKSTSHTVAITRDGGKTWRAPDGAVGGYRSAVAVAGQRLISVGTSGSDISSTKGETWQSFSDMNLNAVAAFGTAVWAVGTKGVIVKLEVGTK